MASTNLNAFSLTHAAVLDPTDGSELSDIYGVRSGSVQADIGNYDNTGDDVLLTTWYWLNFATVQVQGGYIPFETIAAISGETITSSGSAPNDEYEIDLWSEASVNQGAKPLLLRCLARDVNEVVRTFEIILYKVVFAPLSFDGPGYKQGLLLNYTGRALVSSVDETGTTLSGGRKAVGRLRNIPPV